MKSCLSVFFVFGLVFGISANAFTVKGKVVSLGCHNVDDTCFVTLDGQTSIPNCNKSNQLRWDLSTSYGKRWYANFLAGLLTGQTFELASDESKCSSQGFPTFIYGTMNKL